MSRKRSAAKTETMSVPDAGRHYYGLGRNGSYEAAKRGEIPVIPVGRLLRVPIRLMEKQMNEAGNRPAKHP